MVQVPVKIMAELLVDRRGVICIHRETHEESTLDVCAGDLYPVVASAGPYYILAAGSWVFVAFRRQVRLYPTAPTSQLEREHT